MVAPSKTRGGDVFEPTLDEVSRSIQALPVGGGPRGVRFSVGGVALRMRSVLAFVLALGLTGCASAPRSHFVH